MKKKKIHGTYYKIKKNIKRNIFAKYDKIKDWVMDPKGYFLIAIDKKKKLINTGYCQLSKTNKSTDNEMIAIISGKSAIDVLNTLIRKKFISTLQHAGDMGIELCKAELALKNNLKYIQDLDLNLK
jgi:dihydropteroate synthase